MSARERLEHWARRRGIDPALLEEIGVRLNGSAASWPYQDATGGSVGRLLELEGYGWRWEAGARAKGAVLLLGEAQTAETVIVAEGESCALGAWQLLRHDGRFAVLAIPGAGMVGPDLANFIGTGSRVVLATDADPSGDRCAADAARVLEEAGVTRLARLRPDVPGVDEPDLRDLVEHLQESEDDPAAAFVEHVRAASELELGGAERAADVEDVAHLPLYTPRELLERFAAADRRPRWVWDGYVARGAVTLLAGAPKRAGKSTIAWKLVDALVHGHESFCGRHLPGRSVGAVVLSEEPIDTLAEKLEPIIDAANVHTVCREATPRPRPSWAASIRSATASALASGAEVLIIDTFARWASLPQDSEKDTGAVLAALESLAEACAARLAVILVHHHKKGADLDSGEASRGAQALLGEVDVIVDLARVKDGGPRQRQLVAESRFPGTPDALIVELRADGTYAVVAEGEREAARRRAQHERVLEALPLAPPGVSIREIEAELEVGREQAQKLAKAAWNDLDEVERTGNKNEGYRYWRVPEVPS